jgi:tetratricopeptide (TPR) repeat protein
MRPHAWIAFLLAAATFAVFHQVRHHEFVGFDDYTYVVHNPNLRDGLGADALLRAFRPYEVNWIPLTWISLQIDYALYGLDAGGYHLTNAAQHALSTILLYLALAAMTGSVWRSAFVAAVFAVHPLHVESVAWVTERKDTLSGVFWMLTLWAYAHYCRRPGCVRRYLLVLGCLALGLMAKPMLVTLPFALVLLDYWPLNRLGGGQASAWPQGRALRASLIEKLPMFGLAAGASAAAFWIQRTAGAMSALEVMPLAARVANALESYVIYLWKAVWPTGLGVFYPLPLTTPTPVWRVAAAAALLAGVSTVAVRLAAARPYVIVGWLWYLGTLVPVIGLVQVGMQARADRYMYLPLIGLSIAVAWGAAQRWRIPRAALGALALAILTALGVGAWYQTRTWRSTEALFEQVLTVTEKNFLAHKGYGNALLLQGRLDEAELHFAEAARLAPNWSLPRLGLADVALGHGRVDEALRAYRQELVRDPDNMEAIGRYGLALGLAGRYAEARPHLLRALAVHPGKAEMQLGMSLVEAAQGRPHDAVRYGREALRIKPESVEASNNLAWLLATSADPALRRPQEAIRVIERTAHTTGDPSLLDTLAAAYAAAGRFDAAVATAGLAAERAEQQGNASAAATFRERLASYQRGESYVDRRFDAGP